MVNEYGAPIGRNGYAPSILQERMGMCYICGYSGKKLDRHEVFFGAWRGKSKRLGLWVELCWDRHHNHGKNAVHNNRAVDLQLKRRAQQRAMEKYGWDIQRFTAEFGRNYLEE